MFRVYRIFIDRTQDKSDCATHIDSGEAMRYVGVLLLTIMIVVTAATVDSATNSRLEGRVIDDHGDPLTGVQITISSESLIGGPQSVATNEQGAFSFNSF